MLYLLFFSILLFLPSELHYIIPYTCLTFLFGLNLLKGKDLIFACLMLLCIVFGTLFVLHKVLAQCLFFISICRMTVHKITSIRNFLQLFPSPLTGEKSNSNMNVPHPLETVTTCTLKEITSGSCGLRHTTLKSKSHR